jgi:hypothetical protein
MLRAGTVMTAQAETVEFSASDNNYARLPDRFFARLRPTPVAAPRLVRLNMRLALDLGLDPEIRYRWRSQSFFECLDGLGVLF